MKLYISTSEQISSPKSLPVVVLQFALLYLAWYALTIFQVKTWLAWRPIVHEASWKYGYVSHVATILSGLAIMAILKPFFKSEFGLRFPKDKSYVWPAILSGVLIGPLMFVVDSWPSLIHHQAFATPDGLTRSSVTAWLLMQGVFVGPAEELPFRGLLTVYVMSRIPWRVRIGRFDVALGGVIAAELFALAHATSFGHGPLLPAVCQQIYALVLGTLYAYWLENSGSLLAPCIGHNAVDFIEWVLFYALQIPRK